MKVMVIGSGLMGPAAAYNALLDPEVEQVTLADMREDQLAQAQAKLARIADTSKLCIRQVDLNDRHTAAAAIAAVDVVVAALPNRVIPLGLEAAAEARRPWVDLSRPTRAEIERLAAMMAQAGVPVVWGCGLEPGLTEIMARYLAEKLDQVDELHIMCGGIPARPTPPLGYKIVFGGQRLPLHESPAYVVEDGALKEAPRYSGVEPVYFEGVGECEAWHEGFMPWLLELDALKGLRVGTQKTIRWPGFAAKATLLRELGLLSQTPLEVEGQMVTPKAVLDAVLYPSVKMEAQDRDITTFRVEAIGLKNGMPCRYRAEMVDHYDERLGFTAMARVTAFTGAIVARMVGRGEITGSGILTPEKVITGNLFDRLLAELAETGIRFSLTSQETHWLREA